MMKTTASKRFSDPAHAVAVLALGLLLLAISPEATAQAFGSMPWEGPICQVIRSLRGPVVAGLAVGAIAFAGIAMAWAESSMFDFLMKVIIGVGIAVLAVNIVNAFGGVTYMCG